MTMPNKSPEPRRSVSPVKSHRGELPICRPDGARYRVRTCDPYRVRFVTRLRITLDFSPVLKSAVRNNRRFSAFPPLRFPRVEKETVDGASFPSENSDHC